MIPFRFGAAPRQLMGLYHPGDGGRLEKAAVLLCNPFGQEAVRTHRMFRVLAERLARAGIPVLRFDYFGTGDSMGDDTDGDLDAWRDDILLAHQELKRRVPGAAVTWLGVRLGATLACLASGMDSARQPGRLVLWEPLTDGRRYLDEMAKSHRRALVASYSLVPDAYRQPGRNEAMGFGMGDRLVSQLEALHADALSGLSAGSVTLVAGARHEGAAALARLLAHRAIPHETLRFEHAFDWASEEALNTALVPHEALQLLTRIVEKRPE